MICPKCGHEGRETDRFCVKCATKLVPTADEIDAAAEAAAAELENLDAPFEQAAERAAAEIDTLDEAFGEIPSAPLPEEPIPFAEPIPQEPVQAPVFAEPVKLPDEIEPATLQPAEEGSSKPLTTWGFVWRTLLFMIPVFCMIPLFVMAFASGINKNSRSYARSVLIFMLVALLLLLGGAAALFVIFNGQDVITGVKDWLVNLLS